MDKDALSNRFRQTIYTFKKEDAMKKILALTLAVLTGSAAVSVAVPAFAQDQFTVEKFVEAFQDNYTGYYYKNITNMDKFVAALGDTYSPVEYRARLEWTRTAAPHHQRDNTAGAMAHEDTDFLATPVSLPGSKKMQRTAAVKEGLCTN